MDIINLLGTPGPDSDIAALRRHRAEAMRQTQLAFEALLGSLHPGTFSYGERYAIATYVAGVHQVDNATAFYAELMLDASPSTRRDMILAAVEHGLSAGPYGVYQEPGLAAEADPGGVIRHDAAVLGERLAAALDVTHLLVFHPRDARPEVLGHLSAAGWNADDAVTLVQLVGFLSYQLRVIHGLQVLGGQQHPVRESVRAPGESADWNFSDQGFEITTYPGVIGPEHYVSHLLGWRPWVTPVKKRELAAEQLAALGPERAGLHYFRVMARSPQAVGAYIRAQDDLFTNPDGGISRGERELAATVASRVNGCVVCVSMHAGIAIAESGRSAEMARLLAEGVTADLGDERWNAITAAAAALTRTPMQFGSVQVARLRGAGLDEVAILDVINCAAYFNWANRLMLSLGEPQASRAIR
ncbi:CMD domain protein [Corynebacterium sp. A21]|uniref:CMD domain protein n=1 Tax=Corynebacterium sp. A21 TaxID=3457318 RepID=UPI003FCF00EF